MKGATSCRAPAIGRPAARGVALPIAAMVAVLGGTPLAAQTMSIPSITASTPNLGNVAAAASGDTGFRVDASTGSVTKLSGAGARISTTTTRARVTVRCTGDATACNTTRLRVRIGPDGSPSGRLSPLTDFSVASGTATILAPPAPADVIDFLIEPIGRNSNKTFWVGATMLARGDDSGLTSGSSAAGFNVRVAADPATPVAPGSSAVAVANVRRAASISKLADLAFGTVVKPHRSTSKITVDQASGDRTVSGNGIGLPSPATHPATYVIAGEAARTVSVSLQTTFALVHANGSDSLSVNLRRAPTGTLTLAGTAGQGGSAQLSVGGNFTIGTGTSSGTYSGSFGVTIQYN